VTAGQPQAPARSAGLAGTSVVPKFTFPAVKRLFPALLLTAADAALW
jgi:hypothetical protein